MQGSSFSWSKTLPVAAGLSCVPAHLMGHLRGDGILIVGQQLVQKVEVAQHANGLVPPGLYRSKALSP